MNFVGQRPHTKEDVHLLLYKDEIEVRKQEVIIVILHAHACTAYT